MHYVVCSRVQSLYHNCYITAGILDIGSNTNENKPRANLWKARTIKDLQRAITNVKYNFTETLFITVDEAHRTTSVCRSEPK